MRGTGINDVWSLRGGKEYNRQTGKSSKMHAD
jgi:hypothetical protein